MTQKKCTCKPDRKYHRFLWLKNTDNELEEYEFKRVVFGVNTSHILAQYVSQENAKRYQDQFPLAAEYVIESTYVDDTMDSVESDDQGIMLYHQLCALWEKAGMKPRKWMSNSEQVLAQIPQTERAYQIDLGKDELPCMKTLGLNWISKSDVFTYHHNELNQSLKLTKRNILKTIAALFDPLGFLVPYTVKAKIILQKLWLEGVDWDERLSEPLECEIKQFQSAERFRQN